MTAVDQDGELNPFGTAKIAEGIERGACSSAPENHVIDEHDGFVGNVEWDDRGVDVRRSLLVQVIPVHRNVQTPAGHPMLPNLTEQRGQSLGQINATSLNTHEHD